MDKIYILMVTVDHRNPYIIKQNNIVKICKSRKGIVEAANEYMRTMRRMWRTYSSSDWVFNNGDLIESDLFNPDEEAEDGCWWFEDCMIRRTLTTRGQIEKIWSLHVEEWPIMD